MIGEYRGLINSVLGQLTPATQSVVTRIADLPEMIRGYGAIKDGNVTQFEAEKQKLLAELSKGPAALAA